ncbi:MAG: hypothetical protein NVV74_23595 [Magnetospirillum sp.]|nr:hypothetical protein [Magnetospirillum sp.]
MSFRIRFQVSIVTAILLIITAMTAATLVSVYLASDRTARETAGQLFARVADAAHAGIDRQVGQTLALADLGAALPGTESLGAQGADTPALPFMLAALAQEPALYSFITASPTAASCR